jgi:hypothetical protein
VVPDQQVRPGCGQVIESHHRRPKHRQDAIETLDMLCDKSVVTLKRRLIGACFDEARHSVDNGGHQGHNVEESRHGTCRSDSNKHFFHTWHLGA